VQILLLVCAVCSTGGQPSKRNSSLGENPRQRIFHSWMCFDRSSHGCLSFFFSSLFCRGLKNKEVISAPKHQDSGLLGISIYLVSSPGGSEHNRYLRSLITSLICMLPRCAPRCQKHQCPVKMLPLFSQISCLVHHLLVGKSTHNGTDGRRVSFFCSHM
jgi:hypothetical protein